MSNIFNTLDYEKFNPMDYEFFCLLEYLKQNPAEPGSANPVEKLLIGRCDVYEYTASKDENGVTTYVEELIYGNIKCRLSHRYWYGETIPRNFVPQATKQYQLFVLPEYNIKTNSKIVVRQNNVTVELSNSGIISHYETHDQIEVIPFERWP